MMRFAARENAIAARFLIFHAPAAAALELLLALVLPTCAQSTEATVLLNRAEGALPEWADFFYAFPDSAMFAICARFKKVQLIRS